MNAAASTRLRVAVVGGGLVAQAVHLPNLRRLGDRFEIVAIADPSERVSSRLADRYSARGYLDWRDAYDREEVDAVVVCSPNGTHAEVVRASIDLGVHVLVEKPMCIAIEDADAIVAAARARDVVVMVGYMKRYHPGYEALLSRLPSTADGLRMIDVMTYDPWMAREPFVPWSTLERGDDIPEAVLTRTRDLEREQVAQVLGTDDPEVANLYSLTFLGALVHDVNLVHGVLDHLGVTKPPVALSGAGWNGWRASAMSLALPNGAHWRGAWLLLGGLVEFRETASFYFDDAIHRVEFGAPYLADPVVVSSTSTAGLSTRDDRIAVRGDAFTNELEAFHDCIVEQASVRTPPDQARRDLETLRDLYLAGP